MGRGHPYLNIFCSSLRISQVMLQPNLSDTSRISIGSLIKLKINERMICIAQVQATLTYIITEVQFQKTSLSSYMRPSEQKIIRDTYTEAERISNVQFRQIIDPSTTIFYRDILLMQVPIRHKETAKIPREISLQAALSQIEIWNSQKMSRKSP